MKCSLDCFNCRHSDCIEDIENFSRQQLYYYQNREKRLAYNKNYRQDNREKIKKYGEIYRKKQKTKEV